MMLIQVDTAQSELSEQLYIFKSEYVIVTEVIFTKSH